MGLVCEGSLSAMCIKSLLAQEYNSACTQLQSPNMFLLHTDDGSWSTVHTLSHHVPRFAIGLDSRIPHFFHFYFYCWCLFWTFFSGHPSFSHSKQRRRTSTLSPPSSLPRYHLRQEKLQMRPRPFREMGELEWSMLGHPL